MGPSEVEFQRSQSYEESLARAGGESGIDREYWDIFHRRHEVSAEVMRGMLSALSWNISSFEGLEDDRLRRYQENLGPGAPVTAVIGQSRLSVPLSLAPGEAQYVEFDIALEDGSRLAGGVESTQLQLEGRVRLPGGDRNIYDLKLPAEMPLGYHALTLRANGETLSVTNLIVCPDRAYMPEHLSAGGKAAGLNVTLYGLRSSRNWGCGDFTDLKTLIDWAVHEVGFSFIGLNPLHALHNRAPYNTSPYLPLSIFYKNLIYIDIELVPEFRESRWAQRLLRSPEIQSELERLRNTDFVDYQSVNRLKKRFLKTLFREFCKADSADSERKKRFESFCEREGDLLEKFALYCALDEILHKQDRNRWTWQQWPAEYHCPDSEACRRFVAEHRRTVDFYKYIQFVLEEQLAAAQSYAKSAGMAIGLYHDLAVATDSCGSDLWAHGRFYVRGCRVGAPPDDFSPNGQDWAFPPPDKQAHRASGYRLYRESIRKIVANGGALRIDHVMRLFRLFWIPDGATAAQGTYVRDYHMDLIRILALESVRAKAIIVGEDLGTVTDEIRDTLAHFGILSYRLFWFERHRDGGFKKPWEYPLQALVSSSTHDLPTLAGFWTFRDVEARKAAGLADEQGYWRQIEDRKREKQKILDLLHEENLLPSYYERNAALLSEVDGELHNAVVGLLARVPSMLLLLNQEDLTKETEQQNLPGSTAEYPNWQRKMRIKIEDLSAAANAPFASMFRHQLEQNQRVWK